jgi:ankyrin repeat protein
LSFNNSILKTKQVDVNGRHPLGWTSLHIAAVNNNYKVAEILLKHKADPNIGDDFININETASKLSLNPMNGIDKFPNKIY